MMTVDDLLSGSDVTLTFPDEVHCARFLAIAEELGVEVSPENNHDQF
jgi:hypothetical protein